MTPKEQFLKSQHAKAFADIAGSEAFREACNYTLLTVARHLPRDMDAFAFMQGAKQFLKHLEDISIPEESEKPQAKPSLDYDAYNSPARPFLNNPGRTKPTKPTA